MKKQKVIKRKNIESGLNLSLYVIIYLLLDRFNASPLVWGIVGTLCAIVFISTIISIFSQKKVDIFEEINKKSENK